MTSFSEFLSSLDPDAGKRGKQFEHFVKWFLKNDPEWSTQVDQVWLWDEYPNSWGRDCGIDLVFKHKNGENWAVQAKCYAPTSQITKADVDSFISESNRDGIDKRLLIATTDLIGANAKQVCDAQDKPVTRFLLSHFEDADIEYPATLDDLPKAKRKDKPKPRDHQIEAIDAVASNFKDVDRGQLIMACGTGKTFTTLWIKEKLGVESTLVLLPSLGLLSQTLHEWTLATNEEFQVLCVCSDESVGRRGSDEAVHSIADLAFPVTSNANEIRVFLNGSGKKVVFSTYQSSPLIAEAQSDKAVPAFDLAIADEAHRCAGKVSGDFSTILDKQKIRAKKRLFTTATPRTYSSGVKKAAEDRGVEVVGMDDEAVFGKQLFALNFGEAIKRGLLTDYRVVIIGVDNSTISSLIKNRELLKTDTDIEMDAESLATQVGLLKAINDYDLHRLISFHSRVGRAEKFSKDIHNVLGWIDIEHKPSGELLSDFVSGEMPTDKRRKKLLQLKELRHEQRGLLTNARCLSEGVDVPSLDAIAFIDPRSSQIDIIQAVGRAIRLSENKKAGTIILPVFIDENEYAEQTLDAGNFRPIWDVLNALKAHDDVLAEEISEFRRELGRKLGTQGASLNFSKINFDLPVSIDKSFENSLRTQLVNQTSSSWDYWFGMLEAYHQENGHCNIPEKAKKGHLYSLANWIIHQRQIKSILSKERLKRLESISGWSWDPNQDQWDFGISALKDYIETNGNSLIPDDYINTDGFKLGQWVTSKRTLKNLSPEKKLELDALPKWVWSARDESWKLFYESLIFYHKEFNSILVPHDYVDSNGLKLGGWVYRQKSTQKKSLKPYQIKLLESIPSWSWDIDSKEKIKWESGYAYLSKYFQENNSSRVPESFITPDGFRLGAWVRVQRERIKKGIVDENLKRLESFSDWTVSVLDVKWEEGFTFLEEYVKVNGDALVPRGYINSNGYKLGQWVAGQRHSRFPDPVKIKRLESINGWAWDPFEKQWADAYSLLKTYSIQHGDCIVAISFISPEGFPLGRWVSRQRLDKKLSAERRGLLESLAGWKWVVGKKKEG